MTNAHHNHLADLADPAAYKKHLAELAAYQQHLADAAEHGLDKCFTATPPPRHHQPEGHTMRFKLECNISGLRKYCQDRADHYRERLEGMPPIGDKFAKRGVVGAAHVYDTKRELEVARANAQARLDVYEEIARFDITPDTTDPKDN